MGENKGIISDASECTVKMFEKCAFEHKYKVLLVEGEATDEELKTAFEYIYAQYVDYAGLYQTREFEICAYIDSLDNRIQTVRRFVELQKLFIKEFGLPCVPYLDLVKKYGHILLWDFDNPDLEAFAAILNQMERKDARYKMELNKKMEELVQLRKKKVNKEFTLLETRKQFITMLNRLQQEKFVINKNETTIEEVALQIKDLRDQQETESVMRKMKKY